MHGAIQHFSLPSLKFHGFASRKLLKPLPKQPTETPPMMQKSPRRLIVAGFSLVEVSLALGIVSFAVVSVFGCLSVGVSTLRDANRDVTNAQIIAEVSSVLTQTPFAQLQTFVAGTANAPLYFDQAGRQLIPTTGGSQPPTGALYRATLSLVYPDATGSTDNKPYPGARTGLEASANSVQITVATAYGATPVTTSRTVVLIPKS